ncbi:MAG TPA: hypothetical protein VEA69_11960 [Tepidisphaeraceae bacterium]|nr:hypothetical protein [Tepidisphaeraceae bacterium]
MLWLIGLPFVALLVAIIALRVMRNVRHVSELRSSASAFGFPERGRKPSDDYHDQVWVPVCTRVADAAEARLGRALSARERRAVWRAKSALVLEVALKEIEGAAGDKGVVERLLGELPAGVNRPDPTGWCDR